jgi:hypothetical protein
MSKPKLNRLDWYKERAAHQRFTEVALQNDKATRVFRREPAPAAASEAQAIDHSGEPEWMQKARQAPLRTNGVGCNFDKHFADEGAAISFSAKHHGHA